MTELLCLYKAFVIFDLLPCMAFTISDENKQLKNVFFVSLTLTFHVFFFLLPKQNQASTTVLSIFACVVCPC